MGFESAFHVGLVTYGDSYRGRIFWMVIDKLEQMVAKRVFLWGFIARMIVEAVNQNYNYGF